MSEYGPCPRCGRPGNQLDALSRKDNRTYVCFPCGTDEAMRDYRQEDVWPEYPKPIRFDR